MEVGSRGFADWCYLKNGYEVVRKKSHPNQFVWVRLILPIVVKPRRVVRVLIRDVAESRHNAHFPNALCC